jgi:acetyl-CoA carboxylase biotin carboxyl carrier protein
MPFTFKDVAEILRIIDASQCEEVLIELQGLRLLVRRGNGQPRVAADPAAHQAPIAQRLAERSGGTLASGARSVTGARAELSLAEGHIAVRAPMVGTFYRRAAPQQPPFVAEGDRVAKGDPLCLIEVMKLYTTIAAPTAGVLATILAEDGAAVEFDQPLFVIKETAPADAAPNAAPSAAQER